MFACFLCRVACVIIALLTILLFQIDASCTASAKAILGANKFDLLQQYEGYSDFSDRSAAYRHVTMAMARKAILDARDAGIAFLRVSVAGYGGTDPVAARRDMLVLWQSDPATYWLRVDRMFDDLDNVEMRLIPTLLWNYAQFPALVGETTAEFIANPASKGRQLAVRYISEFVNRYKKRKTILFYELTNEFNLEADLDVHRRCLDHRHDPDACVSIANFTTAELDGFAHDMVVLLRRLNSERQVSSGYSLPQPWAYHMRLQPEWTTQPGFRNDFSGRVQPRFDRDAPRFRYCQRSRVSAEWAIIRPRSRRPSRFHWGRSTGRRASRQAVVPRGVWRSRCNGICA